MSILQAIILGLVQGLCEFLPVSSSGHLVLLQTIFGIQDPLFFDTMLHMGTLIAVVIVFRRTLLEMFRHPFRRYPMFIVLATLPTVVIALLFGDFFESAFSGRFLALGFVVTGLLMLLSDYLMKRTGGAGKKDAEQMRPLDALAMGAMQGVAILPGISRSGSTIAGGMLAGLDRQFAADFSFLMSIPAILGSLVLQGKDVLEQGLSSVQWLPILIGTACAAVSGYFAVRFMLRIIKKGKLKYFAVYLFVLGGLILLDQLVFHLFF
jgi:undecaprenyl-diphosphatase